MRLRFWIPEVIAHCPDCDSRHLYRLATVCESRFDNQRERSVAVGARYTCCECGLAFLVMFDGPQRIKTAQAAEASGAKVEKSDKPRDERPRKPPGRDIPVPIKLQPRY